jgi:hypothetical protein
MEAVFMTGIDSDGMQARIYPCTRKEGGFNVTLFDTDAEMTVSIVTTYPTIDWAIAEAKNLVKL